MAGFTNFLQHNPTSTNQEPDSLYASDSLRTGGIGVDSILPSAWLNKIYYQTTTFVAAFAQMMANKGYTMSDASIGNLEAVLANVLTTADTKPPLITVPYSPTPTFDASQANGFVITLSGNVTYSTLINQQIGQRLTFVLIQDGVGGRTFSWPSQLQGALPNQTISSNAGSVVIETFVVLPNQEVVLEDSYSFALNDTIIPNIQQSLANLQNNKQNNLGFTPVTQGGGAGQENNRVFIGWSGSRVKCQIDAIDQGNIVFDAQFDPLQNTVSNLNGTVSGLQSQVGQINSTLYPIPQQIQNLQYAANTLSNEIKNLQNAFGGELQQTGFYTFEGGLIVNWGLIVFDQTVNNDQQQGQVNFATPYNNALFQLVCTADSSFGNIDMTGDHSGGVVTILNSSNSGFTALMANSDSDRNIFSGATARYIAIGF